MNKWRVLIIDDNLFDRQLYKDLILELEGDYKVFYASNGNEGERIFFQVIPDLVFLDLLMPKMDGYEFLKRIRRQPLFENIPIVVVSATSKKQIHNDPNLSGANDFLDKPMTLDKVSDLMEKYLPIIKINRKRIYCSIYKQGTVIVIKINGEFSASNVEKIKMQLKNRIKYLSQDSTNLLVELTQVNEESFSEKSLLTLFGFFNRLSDITIEQMAILDKEDKFSSLIPKADLTKDIPVFSSFEKANAFLQHLD